MLNLYIHIGTHKTGTTFLQATLSKNHDHLISLGILYPYRKEGLYAFGHQNIWCEIVKSPEYKPEYYSISDLIFDIRQVKPQKCILSSEEFSRMRKDEVENLITNLRVINGINIYAVIYLREQAHLFNSAHSEDIRNGFEDEYGDDIYSYAKKYYEYGDYQKMIGTWESVIGEGNVIVRVYEKSQFINNDLLSDFCSVVGISESHKMVPSSEQNQALDIKAIALSKYFINVFGPTTPPRFEHPTYMMNFIINQHELPKWRGEYPRYSILTLEDHNKISELFKVGNANIAKKHFHRGDLFLEPFKPTPITSEYNLFEMTPEEIFNFFKSILPLFYSQYRNFYIDNNQRMEIIIQSVQLENRTLTHEKEVLIFQNKEQLHTIDTLNHEISLIRTSKWYQLSQVYKKMKSFLGCKYKKIIPLE